ncbi:MAG: thioredoxin-dependent thiol peroxidase [Actinomycetota bacterium]
MAFAKGVLAPDFALEGTDGKTHALDESRGRKVVLYFYPKDSTPGCTIQACSYRDSMADFETLNVPVIGVSADSVESHRRFAKKHALSFLLLSDPTHRMLEDYGVWQEKSFLGKRFRGVVRSYAVIDEQGRFITPPTKVGPADSVARSLETLRL